MGGDYEGKAAVSVRQDYSSFGRAFSRVYPIALLCALHNQEPVGTNLAVNGGVPVPGTVFLQWLLWNL